MTSKWRQPWVRRALGWAWVGAIALVGIGGALAWAPVGVPLAVTTWRWHRAVDPGGASGWAYGGGGVAWAACVAGAVAAEGAALPTAATAIFWAGASLIPMLASMALLAVVHSPHTAGE
jgi:hypothetical protein